MFCHDYIAKTLSVFMSKIDINDKRLMKFQNDNDVFNVVVLISKLCFDVYIKNTFWIFRLTKFDKWMMINYEHLKFAWNRTIINKTHTKQILINDIIYIFKCLHKTIQKWFLIETSFENFSNQIIDWITIFQNEWNNKSIWIDWAR